jgi:hypothetical protein
MAFRLTAAYLWDLEPKEGAMKETITRDDLTHQVIPDADAITVELMVGNRTGSFEATQESQDAVAALLFDHDPGKLLALLGANGHAAKPATPKASGRARGDGDHSATQARAWLKTPDGAKAAKELGIVDKGRGRMDARLVKAWRSAQAQAA